MLNRVLHRELSIRSLFYAQLCSHPGQFRQTLLCLMAFVVALSIAPAHSQAQGEGMQTLPQLEPAPVQPEPVQPTPTQPNPIQPSPVQPNLSQPDPRPVLQVGSQGESVSEVQALLKLLGYYSGEVDGVYRANTAAAVSAFQQAVGLQADGIVGANTWGRLLPAPPATTATDPVPAPSPAPLATAPETTGVEAASPRSSETAPPAQAATSSQPDRSTPEASPEASIDLPVLRVGMRGPAVARLQERLKSLGFYQGPIDGVFGTETQAAVQAAQRSYDLEPDGVVGPATWTALLR
ncbi:peptidoglycan-binding protein [Thermocoleostomius sinensis]|uniref:Peptidoglycan-binding protein n=1 Tax=Thermocoleostomius sinensis A174 TaxID=2016057 RepID=A0A9E8ZGY4_9CYAN|nr:peptidoglycan-binding protein [Thermocoleostomius sinensis]WAL61634.1 peptidoglycan-binding protein [Thermocoleostomius sinensis A174]